LRNSTDYTDEEEAGAVTDEPPESHESHEPIGEPRTAAERLRGTLERMADGRGGDAARAALALALWDNVGVPTRVQNLILQMGHEGSGPEA
ncbi:MAG: hypothetical protein OXP66_04350, partial [Candidatus Tectomicrobia bacterium]|nr:hypothetical protein [Candidatus Tectomicrobia bacterium]